MFQTQLLSFLLGLSLFSAFHTALAVRLDDLDHLAFEGVVTDTSGAAIIGAVVTVRQAGSDRTRTATTNSEGRYRLTVLNVAVYHLQAESPGFRASSYERVTGPAGTTIRLDFHLGPGSIEAQIAVNAIDSETQIDATRTVIGGTLRRMQIDELPTASRNVLDLVFILPGVAEPALGTSGLAEGEDSDRFRTAPEETGIFSLNGGTPFSNNLTIEGLDNNDDRAARERFVPSADAVEEVQVITNQFSAEYGRASGGRINLRLRGGSEQFHGRVFNYFRDARLNANAFHRNADPLRGFRLPFAEHNPGASFGGPLVANRAFFFTTYEHGFVSDHAEIASLLPVKAHTDFPLPQPNGANLGSVGIDRQGRSVVLNGGAEVGLYDLDVSTPKVTDTLQTRVDVNLGAGHSGFALATLARNRDERDFAGGRRTLDTMRQTGRDSHSVALSDAFVISERAFAETRFQYSRLSPANAPLSSRPVVLIEIDDPRDVPGLPNPLSRRGNLLTGSSNAGGTDRREDRFQAQETFTLTRSQHQLRMGVDAHLIRSRYIDLEDTTGTFYFASPADFLASVPSRYRHRFDTASELRNAYAGLFLQDDWHLRPNLKLSAGLRYDRETVLADKRNLGPRVALAWDPKSDGRMVIRAGFGLFFNRVLLRTLDDFTLTTRSVLVDTNLRAAESLLGQLRFPKTLDANDPRISQTGIHETGFLRRLERGFRIPESYQSAIGIEREIAPGLRIEVNYVFNRGAHLWREVNGNAPRLPLGFDTFAEYLISRDFDNARDPVTAERPITATGNADFVRFDLTQVSSKVIEQNGKRIVVFGLDNQSTSNASSGIHAALGALRPLRDNPQLSQVEELQARGNSFYHGVSFEIERRFDLRGYFRVSYTLGRLIDDGVVNTSSPLVAGDFRRERAASLLDARHRVVASGIWQLPAQLGRLVVAGTLNLNSPRPFNIGINGNDRNLDDVSNDRPNYNGPDKEIRWSRPGSSPDPVVAGSFSLPLIGETGNLARNAGRGPWQHSLNLRLSRVFHVLERVRVAPLLEAFNPLNTPVFSFGAEFVDFTPTGAGDFLVPRRTLKPRLLRVGVRLEF